MTQEDTTLAAVLDELVPPRQDPEVAGAGRPEVVAYVREKLTSTGLAGFVDPGLAAIDERAQRDHGAAFAAMPVDERAELLRAFEAEQPMLIPILLLHTYAGYYAQPDVLRALGCEPRPPFPKGHDIDIGDDQLLAKIRARVGRP